MGLASLLQWRSTSHSAQHLSYNSLQGNGLLSYLPHKKNRGSQSKESNDRQAKSATSLTNQQWQLFAYAMRQRLPLILFNNPDMTGQGYQSLILDLDQKAQCLDIDAPYPSLPSETLNLPQTVYMHLKQPGSYRHWYLEGQLIERKADSDGPFFKLALSHIEYRDDRRQEPRFTFKDKKAEISCTPAMEPPIYGELDNISLGGVCFCARGNLQQSDAFYLAQHGRSQTIPVNIQLNQDDTLALDIQVLNLQVIKKPFLHTRVRARFAQLSDSQKHILAALTEKSAVVM